MATSEQEIRDFQAAMWFGADDSTATVPVGTPEPTTDIRPIRYDWATNRAVYTEAA